MAEEQGGEVPVTFADGVKDDVRELTHEPADADSEQRAEIEALKRRLAELLLECRGNPYAGELMGPGRHPELTNCRRIRFDVPDYPGKPRFRLIYRNEPTDGAPAECRWLALAPRAGLQAHRKATRRL
jgi:hypothetical protein